MKKINHSQLTEVLKIAYKKKRAVFIHGSIGIGKSQSVKQCAKELAKELKLGFSDSDVEDGKFAFVDVRLSQLEAVDIRGLPHISDNRTVWVTPDWLPKNKESKGIIFFDEYNTASPSVQNASLELILDRKIGNYKLPEGWSIIVAGNLETDRGHLFNLSAPLMNRFLHFELQTPSIDKWTQYASEKGLDQRWITFLNFKPSYLYRFDPKANDKAFPTPRMNEFVCNLIEGITDYKLLDTLISSAVGEGVALEFVSWYKLREKIDLNSIIEKPEKFAAVKEVSMRYSIVSGLAEKYKNDIKLGDRLLEVSKSFDAEYAVLLVKLMASINKSDMQKKMVMGNKKWLEFTDRFGKYFDVDYKD